MFHFGRTTPERATLALLSLVARIDELTFLITGTLGDEGRLGWLVTIELLNTVHILAKFNA